MDSHAHIKSIRPKGTISHYGEVVTCGAVIEKTGQIQNEKRLGSSQKAINKESKVARERS